MVLLLYVCLSLLQLVHHFLCNDDYLRHSCFIQLSVPPCLQQNQKPMEMVRKEQCLY